jgi:hypothetical protein
MYKSKKWWDEVKKKRKENGLGPIIIEDHNPKDLENEDSQDSKLEDKQDIR